MNIYHSFNALLKGEPNTRFALAIGVFDGVHLGHRTIIKALKKASSHTLILTFTNHPAEVLYPESVPRPIISLEEKLAIFKQLGISAVLLIPFTQKLADTSFQDLLDQMPLSHIVLGEGDAFGKNREGGKGALLKYGRIKGIQVIAVPKNKCSSSLIRKHLAANELEEASKLLGRPYNIQT